MDEATEIRRRLAELEASEVRSKRIEKALREIEKRYRRLVENVTDVIFTLDTDWNFTYINPGFEKITGYGIQEMIWHPFSEILAPDCFEAMLEALKTTASDETTESFEADLIHKDGSRIHVELCIMPIFDSSKQATGSYLVAVRDLTERKQAIEEILKAQKLESIGSLAGGIAHDFNNILTGILGNISLSKMYLESEKSADKALTRLLEAEEASIKAKGLTQRLLTFAKGGAPIKKLMSLSELLTETVSLALSGSKSKCEFSISENLWPVEIDDGQINQVINNIIMNADQAMPEGGIIHVNAENVNIKARDGILIKPGPYVKVSVEDHGVGIPPEDLSRIFDPYFTTKQKKNGLGLATAYSIIKRHDGFITAESKLGYGTTLYIYLPASPDKSLPKTVKVEKVIEKAEKVEEKPTSKKGKVLVMDDEAIIRELLGEMLGNLGYEVNSAAGGTEAVGLYKEAKDSGNPYDAIIIDLTIPGGMGGKETIQRIREIEPDVKAIVSSGYSNDPIMAEYEKYGFKGVIAKPYKINELSETLNKVITAKT